MKKYLLKLSILLAGLLTSYSGYAQESNKAQQEPLNLKGSTVVEQVYSPSLEGNLLGDPATQPVKIYLPPGYEHYPKNKYPVLYLLHGHAQNYNVYYSWYNILPLIEKMISEKSIVPMIVVTPSGNNLYTGCMYTNSYVSGNWEDFIVQDVVQYVENNYHVLDQRLSRGLGGFSSGGYGTIKLGMHNPSIYSSICTIGSSALNFSGQFLSSGGKQSIIEAAGIEKWSSGLSQKLKNRCSNAVAFAPDSTALPVLGRFPYTAEGEFIDSTWQKWLKHDPLTMLQNYKDSLLKISAIQMYVGDRDFMLSHNKTFHQALLDHGIDHGFQIFSGEHNPQPALKNLLSFFSEHLTGVVPTVRVLSEYYLETTDSLIAESNLDGKLYVVPHTTDPAMDSVFKYQVATAALIAFEQHELPLSEFEFGYFRVYAVGHDSAISNLPEEFCVVPDTPPDLVLKNDTVQQGDSIVVSIGRDGTICLVSPQTGIDTFRTVDEITNSLGLIRSVDSKADENVSFNTDDLATKTYWIYGYDQFGIISGPKSVEVIEQTGPTDVPVRCLPEVEVFPNPVIKEVSIQVNFQDPYDIVITTLNGKHVDSRRLEESSCKMDLSSFQKGIYFITIRSKDFVTTRKIIKL